MRNLFIAAIVIGVGWYLFGPKSALDVLMEGDRPFVATSKGGIFDVAPSRSHMPDIRVFSEPGLITVVEFYDQNCQACRQMLGNLERLNGLRPDVSIKLVHMTKNYYSAWGNHYGLDVPHVPFTVILDKNGEILAKDEGHEDGGQDLLYKWANAELARK